jgi:hypothetical protein
MPISKDTSVIKNSKVYTLTSPHSNLEVTVREMTGKDMIYLEKMISKKGAGRMECTFRLLEMLSCEPNPITYVELESLSTREIIELTKQLNEYTGMGDENDYSSDSA